MKRLLVLLAGVVATLTVLAATAGAGTSTPTYTLTLTATPSALLVGESTLLAGTLSAVPDTTSVAGYDITMNAYDDETCSTEPYWSAPGLFTGENGDYAGEITIWGTGTYYFAATIDALGITSNCVAVDVSLTGGTTPETTPTEPYVPASSYLCWNQQMVNPVAYLDPVADQMWTTANYFEPQAILGNVVGGTNIGAYHLVCNQPNLTPTGFGVGGSGEVYTADQMLAYHHDHPGTSNDLNVYHIYK